MITIQTPRCFLCGNTGSMSVDEEEYRNWKGGAYIQDAISLPAPEREQLLTGTHPECWDRMFSEEDE